jgi:hypothetical protein
MLKISLIFVPCIIRRSRNNQHYALICTTTAETCRSQCIECRSGTNQCIVLVISTKLKITS